MGYTQTEKRTDTPNRFETGTHPNLGSNSIHPRCDGLCSNRKKRTNTSKRFETRTHHYLGSNAYILIVYTLYTTSINITVLIVHVAIIWRPALPGDTCQQPDDVQSSFLTPGGIAGPRPCHCAMFLTPGDAPVSQLDQVLVIAPCFWQQGALLSHGWIRSLSLRHVSDSRGRSCLTARPGPCHCAMFLTAGGAPVSQLDQVLVIAPCFWQQGALLSHSQTRSLSLRHVCDSRGRSCLTGGSGRCHCTMFLTAGGAPVWQPDQVLVIAPCSRQQGALLSHSWTRSLSLRHVSDTRGRSCLTAGSGPCHCAMFLTPGDAPVSQLDQGVVIAPCLWQQGALLSDRWIRALSLHHVSDSRGRSCLTGGPGPCHCAMFLTAGGAPVWQVDQVLVIAPCSWQQGALLSDRWIRALSLHHVSWVGQVR